MLIFRCDSSGKVTIFFCYDIWHWFLTKSTLIVNHKNINLLVRFHDALFSFNHTNPCSHVNQVQKWKRFPCEETRRMLRVVASVHLHLSLHIISSLSPSPNNVLWCDVRLCELICWLHSMYHRTGTAVQPATSVWMGFVHLFFPPIFSCVFCPS